MISLFGLFGFICNANYQIELIFLLFPFNSFLVILELKIWLILQFVYVSFEALQPAW